MRSRIAAAFSGVTKDLLPKASASTTTTTATTPPPRPPATANTPGAVPRTAARPRPQAEAPPDFERALAAVEARIDQMTDEEVTAFARKIGILR